VAGRHNNLISGKQLKVRHATFSFTRTGAARGQRLAVEIDPASRPAHPGASGAIRRHALTVRAIQVHAIQVHVRRSASAELQMTFRLDGDIPRIWFSSPGVPRIATQLWHHTCFEAFIAVEGQPTYHEFNFAPSGVQCWNCSAGCKGRRLGRCVGLQDLLAAGTLRIQQK
jgi:hypothetical protein